LTGAPQDPFALVGQVLEGQYRVDEVVGEGGCGVVYKGWHIAFEQPVAIKALKMLDVSDAEARISVLTKFREEAKLCYVLSQASLSIVRCIGYGAVVTPTQAWAPYLVLEWLEGRSLADEFADRRRRGASGRSTSEAMGLLAPVAAGLTYAHSQRVAHRDVKPGNLFLVGEGGKSPSLKILDFGVAKVIEEGATAATAQRTKGGVASFTPYYAAPEQIDPRFGPTGPWTDVYGFALVMSEALSGKQPVRGPDVIHVVAQVLNPAQRPTPRALGVMVPDAMEAAFARALALDPKARFPEMGVFWEALAGAARLATSWRPSEGSMAALGWVSPPKTAPMPRVSGPGGAPSGTSRSTVAPAISPSQGQPPGPPLVRRAWKGVVALTLVFVLVAIAGVYALLEYAR
jgi:serine/threonine-protein kinase